MIAESEPSLDFSGSGDIEYERLSNGTLKKLHRFVCASVNLSALTSKVINNLDNRCGPNKRTPNKIVAVANCDAKMPTMVDINVLGKLFDSHWFTSNANMGIGSITHSAFDNPIKIELPSIVGQPKTSFIISQEIWMPLFTILRIFTRSFKPIEHGMNEFDSMVLRFSGDWFKADQNNNLSSLFEQLCISQENVCDHKNIDIGLDDGNLSDTEMEIDTDDYTSESEDWDRRPLSPTSLHAALYNLYNH